MNTGTAEAPGGLRAQLAESIGAESVREDAPHRAFMANDVYRTGGTPLLVVRPGSIEALQAAVCICAAAGVAMVPRSGGASYTDGYLYDPGGHVLFDMGGLDTIDVDFENAMVTVGPGVTWANLKAALAKYGLRTPFWGPFSGLVATVGGSVSQNALSHGSGTHGISAESVLSMDVVLASGELMRTSAARTTRHYGPDLTGLFTGDCGTLGIKAAIRLPLLAARADFEGVSFAFADFASFHRGMQAAQREKFDDSHFGLDAALSQGQIARQEGTLARLRIAAQVLRSAPNKLGGLAQLARMALAGDTDLRTNAYMGHFIVEGVDAADAAARAKALRATLRAHGHEIANSVPTFVRAMPFAPLSNILGPNGERWVPLHGVIAHRDTPAFHDALTALYATHRAEMERLGIWQGAMFSPVGSSGFLYEVALYWPDARTPYHETILGADHLATLPDYPAAAEARAYTERLKQEIVALYARFGAAHFQIGRAYPYRDRLDPEAAALIALIKSSLDPGNLMNPGALGFGG